MQESFMLTSTIRLLLTQINVHFEYTTLFHGLANNSETIHNLFHFPYLYLYNKKNHSPTLLQYHYAL